MCRRWHRRRPYKAPLCHLPPLWPVLEKASFQSTPGAQHLPQPLAMRRSHKASTKCPWGRETAVLGTGWLLLGSMSRNCLPPRLSWPQVGGGGWLLHSNDHVSGLSQTLMSSFLRNECHMILISVWTKCDKFYVSSLGEHRIAGPSQAISRRAGEGHGGGT